MIIDSSALLAVLYAEPDADRFLDAMARADELAMSAASVLESLIAVSRRLGDQATHEVHDLLADLEADVIGLDEPMALLAYEAWQRFGKGRHPAALNYGDAMAYALAKSTGRPLLFKGNDFRQTDISSAL